VQPRYSPVVVRGTPERRSHRRAAALIATLLASVGVLALAMGTRNEGSSTRMSMRASKESSLLLVELQEAAANSTNTTAAGGNSSSTAAVVVVPAEEEEPFELQSWLRTKPDGTWSEFTATHPEKAPFDLSGWLDDQPSYDLNAYLNGQPQPARPR